MSYIKNGNTYLTTKELKEYRQEQKRQKIKRMTQTNAVLWESLKIAIGMIPVEKLKDHKHIENNIYWLMNKARKELGHEDW